MLHGQSCSQGHAASIPEGAFRLVLDSCSLMALVPLTGPAICTVAPRHFWLYIFLFCSKRMAGDRVGWSPAFSVQCRRSVLALERQMLGLCVLSSGQTRAR